MRTIIITSILYSMALATVSTTVPPVSYSCDGEITSFGFDFPIENSSELIVKLRHISTGQETALNLYYDYTVTAANNEYVYGGTVNTITAYGSSYTITIERQTDLTQETHYIEGSVFPAAVVENSLDKITKQNQDQSRDIARCIQIPMTDENITVELPSSIDRANTRLGFDANGNPELYSTITDSNIVITAAAKTVLDDSNYIDMRETIGITDAIATAINDINSTTYVNVKDYGAVGDGITDDTTAILQAIYEVSPITTDYTRSTLADFTAGVDDFNHTNAYRYGGVVFFPAGIYRITSTLYVDSHVTLFGEGGMGIGQSTYINTARGSIIDYDPADANDTVAIAMAGFDAATGTRNDPCELIYTTVAPNISYTYSAQIRDITIKCKTKTKIGIKVLKGISCRLNNVHIGGTGGEEFPIIGVFLGSSWGGNFHNLQIASTTIGLLTRSMTAWAYSGYHYYDQAGTPESTLPYYHDLESAGGDANEADPFPSYSTGIYSAYCKNIVYDALIVEHYDRGFYGYRDSAVITNPYFEALDQIAFHTSISSLTVEKPYINCPDANVFYCQFAKPINDRQVVLRDGIVVGSVYNKLVGGMDSSENHVDGLVIDMPEYPYQPNDVGYNWVKWPNKPVNMAKYDLIKSLGDITTEANIVGLWLFDQTSGTTIPDRGTLSHNLTTDVDCSGAKLAYTGMAPYLWFSNANIRAYLDDHNDFSFGNGSTDSPFSIVALVSLSDTVRPIITKRDDTTASKQQEWMLGFYSYSGLMLKLKDQDTGYDIYSYTADLASDVGELHTYTATYDGSGLASGINIYKDASIQSSTDYQGAGYLAMENKTAKVATYITNYDGSLTSGQHKYYIIAIINKELSAAEIAKINNLFRGYTGQYF